MFKSLIAATAAVGFAALMPAATGRSRSWFRGRRRSRRGRDYSRQRACAPRSLCRSATAATTAGRGSLLSLMRNRCREGGVAGRGVHHKKVPSSPHRHAWVSPPYDAGNWWEAASSSLARTISFTTCGMSSPL